MQPGEHPLAAPIYKSLRAQGVAPPVPKAWGLRLVSEVLRAADHIRLLEAAKEKT